MTHLKYNPYEIGKSLKFAIKMGYLKGLLLDILAESRHLLYLLTFLLFGYIPVIYSTKCTFLKFLWILQLLHYS